MCVFTPTHERRQEPDAEYSANSLVGDANYKLDLRVARDIRVTERMRVELLIEGFNVFNRSNYNGFGTTLYTAAAPSATTLLATPIKLTPTAGFFAPNNDGTPPDGTNARRLQLSIRFLRFAKEAIRLGSVDRVVSLSSVASAVCAALATGARK